MCSTAVRQLGLSICAQAQSTSKDDARKVVTIITCDKAKTKTYCDILKLSQQIGQAGGKADIEVNCPYFR
jgi:hypothetical protein